MIENKIMIAIDELIEDMREMADERELMFNADAYLKEWLQDLVFLGEQAGNLLREISDPESIPSPKDVIE